MNNQPTPASPREDADELYAILLEHRDAVNRGASINGLTEAKAAIQAWSDRQTAAARIEEQQRLIDAIDENQSDRYPKIDENDSLTYVSHGFALACKQMKRNAKVRITKLKEATNDKPAE